MSRHNGHASKGRVCCPGCGRDVSHNHLGTIARHKMPLGSVSAFDVTRLRDDRCPASLQHRKDRPSKYVVTCGRCGGAPWSPAEGCLADGPGVTHKLPPARVR